MGRLKSIAPRLGVLRARLGPTESDRRSFDRDRDRQEWRRWYKTARWQKLRWSVLVRDLFTCQCGCGVTEGNTSLLVADHRKPHRGDPALFWDERNLQTLRKVCHDSWKQRIERAGAA